MTRTLDHALLALALLLVGLALVACAAVPGQQPTTVAATLPSALAKKAAPIAAGLEQAGVADLTTASAMANAAAASDKSAPNRAACYGMISSPLTIANQNGAILGPAGAGEIGVEVDQAMHTPQCQQTVGQFEAAKGDATGVIAGTLPAAALGQ